MSVSDIQTPSEPSRMGTDNKETFGGGGYAAYR